MRVDDNLLSDRFLYPKTMTVSRVHDPPFQVDRISAADIYEKYPNLALNRSLSSGGRTRTDWSGDRWDHPYGARLESDVACARHNDGSSVTRLNGWHIVVMALLGAVTAAAWIPRLFNRRERIRSWKNQKRDAMKER
jgi:hypothetical protein